MNSRVPIDQLKLIPLRPEHAEQVVKFANGTIGEGYYQLAEARQLIQDSYIGPVTPSLAFVDPEDHLVAIRLTLPPGRWIGRYDYGQSFPEKWGLRPKDVAYFKSLFLDPAYRGLGLGPKLSEASMAILNIMGAKAVVTHAWKESPDNSSLRYLAKFGFGEIGVHLNFWSNVDYLCTGCSVKPCTCSAVEMIRPISGSLHQAGRLSD